MIGLLLCHPAVLPEGEGSGWVLHPGRGLADGDYDDNTYKGISAALSFSRHRPRLHVETEPPDEGTYPRVVIAGMGKCGTNALAEALARLGYEDASLTNKWVQRDEQERQGFDGEVNWDCSRFGTHEGLAAYRRFFSPEKANWMDKSTSYMSCAHNMSRALVRTSFFVMLCDPVMSIWSRMNHLRDVDTSLSNPEDILKVIDAKLQSPPQRNCDVITRYEPSLRPQIEICFQLDAGLRYAQQVGEWLREAPGRVRFIVSESAEKDTSYMVRLAARFLGKALPEDMSVGEVHSHAGSPSYLPAHGPAWEQYLSVILPLLRPVMNDVEAMSKEHWAAFGNETVSKWWPSMRDNASATTAETLPKHRHHRRRHTSRRSQLQDQQSGGYPSGQGQQSGQQSRSQESAVQLGQQGSQRRSQQRRDR